MIVIAVTGTPGAGKTFVSKKIAEKLGLKYVDVNTITKKHNLAEKYDKNRTATVVDTKKLSRYLQKEIREYEDSKYRRKNGVVVDSHLSHYLPKKYVDLCIVANCSIKNLKQRLEKRKYSKQKVRDNLDAEIFDVCLVEATEKGHSVMQVDTTKNINTEKLITDAKEKLGLK